MSKALVERVARCSWIVLCLAVLAFGSAASIRAQSTNATLSGTIMDPQGRVVPDVDVNITNVDTNVSFDTKTNGDGIYVMPALPPGRYRIVVTKPGFKQIALTDVVLNVQDTVSRNFTLEVGAASETITVQAGGLNINTTDASVSTVIDQDFIANIPLNGRSLQSLISLAPGAVQVTSFGVGEGGEFSVNGQRTEANYFTVDGVSVNTGANPVSSDATGIGGNVAGETALGTTQSMISLDALQEFRATTSTYSAEYGRTPGGQFSFVSRSGSNDWHGSAYDYFRNSALDADNWFNNALGVRQTAERQNDFGGTLGGPVRIPGLYNGKDKTFFFFSYEGLRLLVPAGAVTAEYPDSSLRQNAPAALQPFLNAFPVPHGPEVLDANGNPIGLAVFTGAYSNPSSLDAISLRVDHNVSGAMKIFGRYSQTPSSSGARNLDDLAELDSTVGSVKSVTLGATNTVSPRLINEFRLNYTSNNQSLSQQLDNFGGAQPVGEGEFPGFSGASSPKYFQVGVEMYFGTSPQFTLGLQQDAQQQWNVSDAFSVNHGSHNLKFGIDYRRLSTSLRHDQLGEDGSFCAEIEVLQNEGCFQGAFSFAALVPPLPLYTNFSLYAQDEWKVAPRLSLSLGLRWDVNPPPGNGNGPVPPTLNQITNLNTAQLAPLGTPLWQTDYHAFAPRVGAAYVLRQSGNSETVVRGGFGVFYDTGNALGSAGFSALGYGGQQVYFGVPFPLTPTQLTFPPASLAPPYDNQVFAFDPHLELPYTMQWNVSVEQSLGNNQALTVSYVGSAGRDLLFTATYFPNTNPNFVSGNGVRLVTNAARSDYNALQVQFQRKLSHGLQALASYTFSHSIDDGSNNFFDLQPVRGNSDFDLRHNFQMALTYDLPGSYSNPALSAILKHWGLDARVSARSSLPEEILSGFEVLPNGQQIELRPNLVPDVPIYLYGSQYPGGRIINFAAFEPAATGTEGNLPRGSIRGFDAVQSDLALRRDFPLNERVHLQFRAEAFNLLNHPSFGNINDNLSAGAFNPATLSGFGAAQSTLNSSLGGLNALYQIGGPRSLQLMLRLSF